MIPEISLPSTYYYYNYYYALRLKIYSNGMIIYTFTSFNVNPISLEFFFSQHFHIVGSAYYFNER